MGDRWTFIERALEEAEAGKDMSWLSTILVKRIDAAMARPESGPVTEAGQRLSGLVDRLLPLLPPAVMQSVTDQPGASRDIQAAFLLGMVTFAQQMAVTVGHDRSAGEEFGRRFDAFMADEGYSSLLWLLAGDDLRLPRDAVLPERTAERLAPLAEAGMVVSTGENGTKVYALTGAARCLLEDLVARNQVAPAPGR